MYIIAYLAQVSRCSKKTHMRQVGIVHPVDDADAFAQSLENIIRECSLDHEHKLAQPYSHECRIRHVVLIDEKMDMDQSCDSFLSPRCSSWMMCLIVFSGM